MTNDFLLKLSSEFMKAMLANPNSPIWTEEEKIIHQAIKYAELLIAELELKKEHL